MKHKLLGLLVLIGIVYASFVTHATLAREPEESAVISPEAVNAFTLQITKADRLINDLNNNMLANPGDTIRYTVIITNPYPYPTNAYPPVVNDPNAVTAVLSDVLDPVTTLVPGSLNVSPLAAVDVYTAIGNTYLAVGTPAPGPAVSVTGSVFANDREFGGDSFTLQGYTAVTQHNGSVTVNTDGTFVYLPPVGYTGIDTWQYTIVDSQGLTGTANVYIRISAMVWYVDPSATTSADRGHAGAPFVDFNDLNGVNTDIDNAGDYIYLYNSTHTGNLPLEANQQLIGAGVALVVNGNTLMPASTPATFTGVTGTAVTLATNNTLRGFNIANTTGFAIQGTSFGSLTVNSVGISGAGGVLSLTTGTLNAAFTSLNTTSAANGIVLSGVNGSLSSAETRITATTTGINIQNSASLTFQTNTVGTLQLTTSAGTALLASNGGTLVVSGVANTINASAGPAINLTTTSFSSGAVFATVSSTNSPARGITLTQVSGSLVMNGGAIGGSSQQAFYVNGGIGAVLYAGAITNAADRSVEVLNRTTNTVTVSGNISDTGTGISVHDSSGGTITFSGASKNLTIANRDGVLLVNNTGATINFTNGGLVITGDTVGVTRALFEATGGGTITVQGAGNRLIATNRQAVKILNTTIGGGQVTFETVSANGTTIGADLSNIGTGGFNVTGTGTAGSGGTLQNLARGYQLINATNVNLNYVRFINASNADGTGVCDGIDNSGCNAALSMQDATTVALNNSTITGSSQQGINGLRVANLNLNATVIINSGNQVNEAGIYLRELRGTSSFNQLDVSGSAERNVYIKNETNVSLTLTVSNSSFHDSSATLGADGLEMAFSAGTATLDVLNSSFLRNRTFGMQVLAEGTSTVNLDFTGNTVNPGPTNSGNGIDTSANNSATLNVNIIGNPELRSRGGTAVNIAAFLSSTINARVNDNPNIRVGGAGTSGWGIRINNNEQATIVAQVDNNVVNDIGTDSGIQAVSRGGTGRADVTISNNIVTIVEDFGVYGIEVRAQDSNTLCANVSTNTVNLDANDLAAFRERTNAGSTVLLQDLLTTVVANWNTKGNTPANSVSASNNGTVGDGTCDTATHALPRPAQTRSVETNGATKNIAAPVVSVLEQVALAAPVLARPVAINSVALNDYAATSLNTARLAQPTTVETVAGTLAFPINLGRLGSETHLTVVFDAVIASSIPAGVEFISNQARLQTNRGTFLSDDPATVAANDPTLTPLFAAADLALTKSDGGITAVPGSVIPYTLTYTNSGDQASAGTVLRETVPAHTTFNAGASTAGWVCAPNNNAGSSCTLSLGTVAALGGSGSAVFAVTVSNPIGSGVSQIANTASITASEADPTPANNTASDTTPVTAQPDLTLTKSDGGITANPGNTIAYTLSFANVGNQHATGVVITEIVPTGTTFNPGASSAGWLCSPNNMAGSTCTVIRGAVNGGTGGTLTFAVTVIDPVPAGFNLVSNTASIADDGANGADPTPGNNTAIDTTPLNVGSDLTITKSDGGVTAAPGDTIVYTLAVTNTGNQVTTGVVVTETVPLNTTFNAAASTIGWNCSATSPGSICTFSIGTLNGATTQSILFAVTVDSPVGSGVTQISNSATVGDSGVNGADPTPGNNTATDTTPLNITNDLVVTKSAFVTSVVPGQVVTYTIELDNTASNQVASSVIVTEVVPLNTTFNAAASTPGWLCQPSGTAGSECVFTTNALGQTVLDLVFAVTVDAAVPAGVTDISNTVTAALDGDLAGDATPADNSDTLVLPLVAAPDLTLTKSDGGVSVAPGDSITYTLTISNIGNQAATNVVVSETVPAATSFNATLSSAGWTCTPDAAAGSACTYTALTSLPAGQQAVVRFVVDVINPVSGVTEITNTASVADDGANGSDATPSDNTASETTPLLLSSDAQLAKSVTPVLVSPGATITYTLDMTLTGDTTSSFTVTDSLPAGLVNPLATFSSNVTWNVLSPLPNLVAVVEDAAPGTVAQISITAQVDPAFTGASITNTATIESDYETTPADNADSAVLTLNQLPVAATDGPYTLDEGSTVLLSAAASTDDGSLTYDWDLDNDGLFDDASGVTTLFTNTLDDAVHVVAVQVTDSFGLTDVATTTVTVLNVAPSVDAGPDQTAFAQATLSFTGTFTDPGVLDTHMFEWDFDDGSTASGSLSTSHAWAAPGTYTVTLTVTDDDGGVGIDSLVVTISENVSSGKVFLPIVRKPRALPDVVVQSIVVTPSTIQVTITNIGGTPVTDAFWLELYLNPTEAPTRVNQIWPNVGDYGAVWGMNASAIPAWPLDPGESVTVDLLHPAYYAEYSNLPAVIAAGSTIYVQVDSANDGVNYGAVLESHEVANGPYNNISRIVTTVDSTPPAQPRTKPVPAPSALPPRPIR